MAEPKIGPTGEAPVPGARPGDKGGLNAVVYATSGLVRVDFWTLLSYVDMSPSEARAFAHSLTIKATEAERLSQTREREARGG